MRRALKTPSKLAGPVFWLWFAAVVGFFAILRIGGGRLEELEPVIGALDVDLPLATRYLVEARRWLETPLGMTCAVGGVLLLCLPRFLAGATRNVARFYLVFLFVAIVAAALAWNSLVLPFQTLQAQLEQQDTQR